MQRVLIASALAGFACSVSFAGLSMVTSEATFGTNDTIDWGQYGPRGTSMAGHVLGTSVGGRGFWAESYAGDNSGLSRVDQWTGNPDPFTGWAGNFAANEKLVSVTGLDLVTPPTTDARLTLTFNEAILGFGAQFDANFSNAWMMHIQAFDSDDNLLGLFDLSMKRSKSSADNTAQFMGVRSDSMNISRLEIWATAIYSTDKGPTIAPDYFALNFGRLVVPAPGTSLFVIAMGSLMARRSRRVG